MKFDLRNKIQRKIFVYSASLIIAILAYLVLSRVNSIFHFIGTIISVLTPFLLGFGIAFLLDGPIQWICSRLRSLGMKKNVRGVSTAVVFLLFALSLILVLWVVIPSLVDSIKVFVSNFSTYAASFEKTVLSLAEKWDLDTAQISSFFQSLNLSNTMSSFMQKTLSHLADYSINVVHMMTNFLIAFAAAIYMVLDKKNLLKTVKSFNYALLGRKNGNYALLYTMDAKNVFQQYIVGNLLDSLLVGIICWFGCMVMGLSYSPMVGLIVGITNIIPVFGPFLGAIPVILLYLLINPMHALIFAVFILILQQIDGNVLKPLILGDKLGISGFWILFSVSVGGSLFGAVGMFLGVPVFALIYEWVQDFIELHLRRKNITVPEKSGVL